MRAASRFGLVLLFGVVMLSAGCGSSSAVANDGAVGGAGGPGGSDGAGGSGAGGAAGAVNPDCPEGTNDKSGIPGQINLFPGTETSLQYRQPCITIKAGQSFKFQGDFTIHPLRAKAATTTTPIPALTSTGTELLVVFPSAGTFNYDCVNHPTVMFGTVNVKP